MRAMKNSGVEWIGEIPSDWNICRFKNVCSLFTGNSIKDEKKSLYEDSNKAHPYIATKDIDVTFCTANYDNGMYVKDDDNSFKIAPACSTLMCIEGGSAGRKKTKVKQNVSFVNKLCCLYSKTQNNNFLYYFLSSPNYESEFKNNINGLIGGVSVSVLKNIAFLLPPLETQQRIADYLDEKCGKIDAIIEREQAVIEKLKEYKQSIITEAVTKGLNPHAEMKDSGIEWIGEIPKNWNTSRVKWLLDERKERSERGKEEPLSMSQKHGLIPTKNMESIPNMASSYIGAKIVYKNDLVFNKLKAHLGVFSVSKYKGLVSPDYAVYYTTGQASLKYLEYIFKTPQCICEFRKKSSGIADGLTRLYTSGLFSIFCPFPTLTEQQQIADYLDKKCAKIDKTIETKQSVIDKLTEYKKSLIYEVVTGKKEI